MGAGAVMDGWRHPLCHLVLMIPAGLATREHFLISPGRYKTCVPLHPKSLPLYQTIIFKENQTTTPLVLLVCIVDDWLLVKVQIQATIFDTAIKPLLVMNIAPQVLYFR